jgi:hypothetical protein
LKHVHAQRGLVLIGGLSRLLDLLQLHTVDGQGQRKLRLEARQCHRLAVGRTWINRGGMTDLQPEQPELVRLRPSTIRLSILPRPSGPASYILTACSNGTVISTRRHACSSRICTRPHRLRARRASPSAFSRSSISKHPATVETLLVHICHQPASCVLLFSLPWPSAPARLWMLRDQLLL